VAGKVDLHEPRGVLVPLGQVRIGIWDLSIDPGLVWDLPVNSAMGFAF
jgi:hypothetical protein